MANAAKPRRPFKSDRVVSGRVPYTGGGRSAAAIMLAKTASGQAGDRTGLPKAREDYFPNTPIP